MNRRATLALVAAAMGAAAIVTFAALDAQTPVNAPNQNQSRRPSPPRTTGVVVGQVIDGATGKGVSGAVVSMNGGTPIPLPANTPPPSGNQPPPGVADEYILTGQDGQFVFHALTRGTYSLEANASGYVPGSYGQHRPNGPSARLALADDERVGGVTLTLWHVAAISGTVRDEHGDPIVRASVRLLRRQSGSGQRQFVTSGQSPTDDRGMYRFGKLVPGEYIPFIASTETTVPTTVADRAQQNQALGFTPAQLQQILTASGAPQPNASGIQIGGMRLQVPSGNGTAAPLLSTGSDGSTKIFIYPATYYPASATAGAATPVVVASGEEKPDVDFQLRPVSTGRISGLVNGPDGPAINLGLHLYPVGTDGTQGDVPIETATTMTDSNGAFTFLAVPSGRYLLRGQIVPPQGRRGGPPAPTGPAGRGRAAAAIPSAIAQTLWTEQTVVLADADLDAIALTMRSGITVNGKIEFDGAAAQPQAQQLAAARLALSALDPIPGVPNILGTVNADGTFTIPGLLPGRYLLANFNVSGWTLKDAQAGGRSVADVPFRAEDPALGQITVTMRPATQSTAVSGTVRGGMATASDDVQVILFPEDYANWIDAGMPARRWRAVTVSKTGTYRASGLPAGQYIAVAAKLDDLGAWPEPALAATLAGFGTHLSLNDAEQKTLDLSVVRIR